MGSILPKSKVEYLRNLARYGEKEKWCWDLLGEEEATQSSWSGIAEKELLNAGYALEYQEGEEYAPEE